MQTLVCAHPLFTLPQDTCRQQSPLRSIGMCHFKFLYGNFWGLQGAEGLGMGEGEAGAEILQALGGVWNVTLTLWVCHHVLGSSRAGPHQ